MGHALSMLTRLARRNKQVYSTILVVTIAGFVGGSVWVRETYHVSTDDLRFAANYAQYVQYVFAMRGVRMNSHVRATTEDEVMLPATSVPVLLYHGVVESHDGSNVTRNQFEAHMRTLAGAGYETIGIEEFYDFVRGTRTVPQKSFLLAFDDSRKDSYYPVDPLLKALGFRAVMFTITGRSLGSERFRSAFHLTARELGVMHRSGRWDIESHGKDDHELETVESDGSAGHFLANARWLAHEQRMETRDEYRARIADDLAASKHDIERALGKKLIGFAFPFGDYGQNETNLPGAKEILLAELRNVYPLAFYQSFLPNERRNYPYRNSFMATRIVVRPEWDEKKLLALIEASGDKALPYEDAIANDNGWYSPWGIQRVENGALTIEAEPSEAGASAFLDGTYLWQRYSAIADITAHPSSTVSIVAHANETEQLSCVLQRRAISLRVQRGAAEETLLTWYTDFDMLYSTPISLGISLGKNGVKCLWENHTMLHLHTSAGMPSQGGVGVKVWSDNPQARSLTLEHMRVERVK